MAMLLTLAATLVGLLFDPRVITGAPAWLKPAKFAVSIAIYCFTLLWLLTFVRGRPRLVRPVAWATAVALGMEMVIIAAQVVRGTTSHFNVATPLDSALWEAMAFFVVVVWVMNLLTAVLLLVQRMPDPAFAWSLRLGVLVSFVGMSVAFLMTTETPERARAAEVAGISALNRLSPNHLRSGLAPSGPPEGAGVDDCPLLSRPGRASHLAGAMRPATHSAGRRDPRGAVRTRIRGRQRCERGNAARAQDDPKGETIMTRSDGERSPTAMRLSRRGCPTLTTSGQLQGEHDDQVVTEAGDGGLTNGGLCGMNASRRSRGGLVQARGQRGWRRACVGFPTRSVQIGYSSRPVARTAAYGRGERWRRARRPFVTEQMYDEIADWWPVISPPSEYAEEAALYVEMIRAAAPGPARELLELGSGGGNNASLLKRAFSMTLVEPADKMREISRKLNPECTHVPGDMRSVRLGRTLDAVMYMTTEEDLRAALRTVAAHLAPGGVPLVAPDATTETFSGATEHGGSEDESGRRAMSGVLYTATLATALGCGLVSGVVFAFSGFVTPALKRLSPAHGIAAMQSINALAVTPAFMTTLFGTAVASLVLVVWAAISWGEWSAALVLAGCALYLVGTIGVTIARNVPLNDGLATLHPQGAEAAGHWDGYVSRWTAWNHARTVAALAAATLLSVALHI
jgi:uncharacterized membrane protein